MTNWSLESERNDAAQLKRIFDFHIGRDYDCVFVNALEDAHFALACMGTGAWLIASFVGVSLSVHMCKSGVPTNQWFVPAIGIGLITAFSEKGNQSRSIALLALIGILVFGSLHATSLMHPNFYTGNPEYAVNSAISFRKSEIRFMQDKLQEANQKKVYPAGWMKELPIRYLPSQPIENSLLTAQDVGNLSALALLAYRFVWQESNRA